MSELEGKVAIVTGASAGIGLAVSRRLSEAGARVAMVARTPGRLADAARSVGERARPYPGDVSDLASLHGLVSRVMAEHGGLDILVNNAGLNHRGPISDHSARELADVITTNLTAPIYLTRVCAEHIRRGGAIVNVASLAGMVPVVHAATYSASKAGLRAFTRAVADELSDRDIHVSSVCPGPVDTEFFGDVATVPDIVFSQPMRTADDVADAVMQVIRSGTAEIAVPALSGTLATLGYLFPSLEKRLRPILTRRGARNKQRYMASKQKSS
jgi:short-subunit dehydrogenase